MFWKSLHEKRLSLVPLKIPSGAVSKPFPVTLSFSRMGFPENRDSGRDDTLRLVRLRKRSFGREMKRLGLS